LKTYKISKPSQFLPSTTIGQLEVLGTLGITKNPFDNFPMCLPRIL